MKAGFSFLKSLEQVPDKELKAATSVEVRLFGSLSATGKGHGTDRAVTAGLLGWEPHTCDTKLFINLLTREKDSYSIKIRDISIPFGAANIIFDKVEHKFAFQNTMIFRLLAGGRVLLEREYYSIGGGFVRAKGAQEPPRPQPPYQYGNMNELKALLASHKVGFNELILKNEEAISGMTQEQVFTGLDKIIEVMEEAVERGLKTEGVLPGPIGLRRKAPTLYKKAHENAAEHHREHI